MNGLWYAYLKTKCQTPSVGCVCAPYPKIYWCDQSLWF